MPTSSPFHDGLFGPEIREKLNAMWADWLAAIETAVGKDGWSPMLRLVADGQRSVVELYDWVGGTTNKPPTGFLGAAGLVPTAAQAVNLRGPEGNPGPVGPANELGVGTVGTGNPGTDVLITITGTYPNQKINITIPRGDTGDVGATPTIEVGTVTTGEPGSDVVITPRGTPTELILDFVIPRGDKGQNGDGTGDVVGPNGVDDLQLAQFDGPTGKIIRAINLTGILAVEGGRPYVAAAGEAYATPSQLDGKVDKVAGMGLSSNDFTNVDASKLDSIAEHATANQTDAYLLDRANHTGEQAIDTVAGLTSALGEKQATLVSGENIKTINGQDVIGSGNLQIDSGAGIHKMSYAKRAELRALAGEYAMVDTLGFFQFEEGSVEVDDDESSFATANGCWILQCPSFDLIEAWNLPRNNMLNVRVIPGAINMTATAVAGNSIVSVTSPLPGVEPGDTVIMTPPGGLGTTTAGLSILNYYAYCTIAGTVGIVITNVSAASVPIAPKAIGLWPVLVIKAN